ncbi:glycerol-3-phosphate acyltransferase 1 [Sporosarcina sp. NCCP-2716]|uniref:glycerol-3-phosphate acyltransferase n=1 Tax=Sporosarcina sp. NCCP-2716 TaxID=2943679 RepID=UPI0020426CF3|nr:glycerol-3-phosphate acyltransferase [Sporosarcina sp. NCCP-2716]GKV70458.1 glycerol-3-phosphate acyltransferase 1 [Sporosarcina sp. NCCP-2716]
MAVVLLIGSYVLGGFLPALYAGGRSGRSVRTAGSGNPGARNAGRVFGKRAFITVLVVDAAKGAIPVLAATGLGYGLPFQLLALTAVMLGHCFPLFHHFRGGKGAAAFAGGLLAADPWLAVPVVALFAVLYPLLRKTTRAGVLAASAAVPGCIVLHGWTAGAVSVLPVALLLFAHRSDLRIQMNRRRSE